MLLIKVAKMVYIQIKIKPTRKLVESTAGTLGCLWRERRLQRLLWRLRLRRSSSSRRAAVHLKRLRLRRRIIAAHRMRPVAVSARRQLGRRRRPAHRRPTTTTNSLGLEVPRVLGSSRRLHDAVLAAVELVQFRVLAVARHLLGADADIRGLVLVVRVAPAPAPCSSWARPATRRRRWPLCIHHCIALGPPPPPEDEPSEAHQGEDTGYGSHDDSYQATTRCVGGALRSSIGC